MQREFLDDFLKDERQKFPKDSHAIFAPSNYHWINYDIDKMIAIWSARYTAAQIGTELHDLAARCIKLKQPLPDVEKTLNMYVNDSILFNMYPEKQLYYSDDFKGTADAIVVDPHNVLRIHDLKTGVTKASLHQLEIYAALFCLDAGCSPCDFVKIELRIYQNNDILVGEPPSDVILPIMDKIVTVDKLISKLRR